MPQQIRYHRPPTVAYNRDATRRAYEDTDQRKLDKSFYGSAAWLKLRRAFLAENPLCADCRRAGRVTAAEHVHHVVERKADPSRALDWSNLEALCPPCHNRQRRH